MGDNRHEPCTGCSSLGNCWQCILLEAAFFLLLCKAEGEIRRFNTALQLLVSIFCLDQVNQVAGKTSHQWAALTLSLNIFISAAAESLK